MAKPVFYESGAFSCRVYKLINVDGEVRYEFHGFDNFEPAGQIQTFIDLISVHNVNGFGESWMINLSQPNDEGVLEVVGVTPEPLDINEDKLKAICVMLAMNQTHPDDVSCIDKKWNWTWVK